MYKVSPYTNVPFGMTQVSPPYLVQNH